MSPDPANVGAVADNPQSWNAYSYALNNPETLTDPLGACVTTTLMGAVGGSQNQGGMYEGSCSAPPLENVSEEVATEMLEWDIQLMSVLSQGPIPPTVYHSGHLTQMPTQPQTTGSKITGILTCAEGTANRYSIAGLLGVKDSGLLGTAAYAFGGNAISQVLGVASHFASGLQAASTGNRQGVAAAALRVQGDLMLGGTLQGVLTGGMGNPAAQGLVGTAMEAVFGTAAEAVGVAKLGVDAAVFAASMGYCVAHH